MPDDRLKLARETYGAYESGDRAVIEGLLTDDFTFFSPADPGIDLTGYFERCWPNSELIEAFELVRLVESGDEVIVTYEATKAESGFETPRCSPSAVPGSARRRSISAGTSIDPRPQ